jgi:hypothetical protein
MGRLSVILAEAPVQGPGVRWPVSVTTNQDGGHVSLSSGLLCYLASRTIGPYTLPERLATEPRTPLLLLGAAPCQDLDDVFAADTADQVGLSISRQGSRPAVAHFTLTGWPGSSFDVVLDEQDGALVGMGPGVGTTGACATFVIALGDPIAMATGRTEPR